MLAAQYHSDKHCIKMILESCQILSTVMHKHGLPGPYRPTHANHPCVLWAGRSRQNFDWLVRMVRHLCTEYTRRYGKVHKCDSVVLPQIVNPVTTDLGLTPFALAMPDQYRCADPVASYRAYYHGEKAYFATWKTQKPAWFCL